MKGSHTKYGNGFTVSYWKKGTAVGMEDDWDIARVEVADGAYKTGCDIDTRFDLGNLVIMLDRVFEKGKAKAKQEIRDALGIERKWP